MVISFLRLDFTTLLPLFIFRIMGAKVYYLDVNRFFMKNNRHLALGRVGIKWIDHQQSDSCSFGELMRLWHERTIEIGEVVLRSRINEVLLHSEENNNIFQTAVYEIVQSSVRLPLELVLVVNSRADLNGGDHPCWVWMPKTFITDLLIKPYEHMGNMCPRWWVLLEVISYGARRISSRVSSLIFKIFKKIENKMSGSGGGLKIDRDASFGSHKEINEFDAEVAFFPHQGLLYGDMYVKDHFYSSVEGDAFNSKRIMHLELERPLNKPGYDFYKANNLTFGYWDDIECSKQIKKDAILKCIFAIMKLRIEDVDLEILIKFSRMRYLVDIAIVKLKKFNKLKVVLVGYDMIFPQWLAVACRLTGIKTVAIQERMVLSWILPPLLFDIYLTMGPQSAIYLQKRGPKYMRYCSIGPVRLPKYVDAEAEARRILAGAPFKDFEAVVLAMDMHSSIDATENGRALGNNWRINSRFYVDLLRLSEDFPEFIFLLKGKDVNFTKVDYLRPLSDQMLARSNIKILDDSSVWTPFVSVAVADIGFARHTSMADEMMALGKPVIFHDTYGFPSQVFDYGSEVTMHSYPQFVEAFRAFKHDRVAFNAKYDGLRQRLFGERVDVNLGIQDILHEQLC